MNIFYFGYKILSTFLVLLGIVPFFVFTMISGKYRKHLGERFGFFPERMKDFLFCSKGPRIWIHAVSLGEIKVAMAIVSSLKTSSPDCTVILSTATEHGRELAVELFADSLPVIYAPVDCFLIVRKVLRFINPDVLLFLETEIWPSWIIEARNHGVEIALLNGRISSRSFRHYLKFSCFFKIIMKNISIFSMISDVDRDRAIQLGADPDKITVNGNAKYDFLPDQAIPGTDTIVREKLFIDSSAPVIVAGSTRTGEEEVLLKAYDRIMKKFPETLLIIAPRHLERMDDIISLLEDRGTGYHLRSEFDGKLKKRKEKVILIDKYGELFNIYSIATIAFCGASLVPLGGQNPFEPAAWGVPVFHGPYMGDFHDAKHLLDETGGNIEIHGDNEFYDRALELMCDGNLLKKKGEAAKKALLKNKGAAINHAVLIRKILSDGYRK